MKKQKHISVFVFLLFVFLVTGCTGKTAENASADTEEKICFNDSYWTAYEWEINYEADVNNCIPLPTEEWRIDLTLLSDGLAQLRDIYKDISLQNENDLYLKWTEDDDGKLYLNNSDSDELVWEGIVNEDTLLLEYMGGTLRMKQEEMPKACGEINCPAQLKGTWMMISDETGGNSSSVLPGHFESLIIKEDRSSDSVRLVADMENKDYYGTYMIDSFYGQEVEVIYQPIYDGCENESWCARIERDESTDPRYTKYKFTLLDNNTLLMQKYSAWDDRYTEYIYHKTLPKSSHWDIEAYELPGLFLRCKEYIDINGNVSILPENMKDFYVFLTEDNRCLIGQQFEGMDEALDVEGSWQLGNGGTMMFTTEDYEHYFWYEGAIRGSSVVGTDGYYEDYELYIYYDGGIMKLTPDAAG